MFDLRKFAAIAPDLYSRLSYHEQLASTNDEARELAENGAEHGHVVLADHQTMGRGRRGAAWLSEPGTGLLFSIVLRPDFPKGKWGRLALAAGLGVVDALNGTWSLGATVKWPNDIYLQDRKCAGILAEQWEGYMVLGIGLNVSRWAQGSELDTEAIALEELVSAPIAREKVLAIVLDAVMREVELCGSAFGEQLERLGDVFFLAGKDIEFTVGQDRLRACVLGLSDDGSLLVRMPEGDVSFPQASGIRLV